MKKIIELFQLWRKGEEIEIEFTLSWYEIVGILIIIGAIVYSIWK